MKRLAIVGDSFGCGEWMRGPIKSPLICVHAGTSLYLKQKNYQVKNYSVGGHNMQQLLDQILKNNLRKQTIIVFATDSLRHIDASHQKLWLKKGWSISELHFKLFQHWIKNLTKITQQQRCEVVLIGGFGNLYDFPIPSNLQVCTYAWISDILGHPVGNQSSIEVQNLTTLHGQISRAPNDVEKKELIYIMDQIYHRENLLRKHPDKFPDGIHPSRECHKLLTDKIINLIG